MEESKSIILPTKEYANAISRDLDYNVELESTQNLMRLGDRDIVLNLNDLFGAERAAGIDYKIFGKLTILYRDQNHKRYWFCKCSCNNQIIEHSISATHFASGHTNSCGCLQKESAKETIKIPQKIIKDNIINIKGHIFDKNDIITRDHCWLIKKTTENRVKSLI